ncbi:hypothetical protein BDN72DRAFT_838410 [Pluteus cervinus]|uniref:Uncharacterized protein n=1 Tax=Pluteus cervinus TaxID=181527 RepID=A0ACD3AYR6_9AGAR|nr:hypothetical protein BDN72DRAFT_838410 [Pluteus cervinus]
MDDSSKVVVHSELGLLIHYLKIRLSISRGEGAETALPVNYIGTSMLQCGFCRAIFRVLQESVLPATISLRSGGGGEGMLRGYRFPRNWGFPEELVNVVQQILIHHNSQEAQQICCPETPQAKAELANPNTKLPLQDPVIQQYGWPVPVPVCSIADPISATQVQETVMRLFMLKLSEVLCHGWEGVEDKYRDFLSFGDYWNAEYKLAATEVSSGEE